MQVSNIEITVSNELVAELPVAKIEETSVAIRFTELQHVGGGNGVVW
jgi:hypothetical protein